MKIDGFTVLPLSPAEILEWVSQHSLLIVNLIWWICVIIIGISLVYYIFPALKQYREARTTHQLKAQKKASLQKILIQKEIEEEIEKEIEEETKKKFVQNK